MLCLHHVRRVRLVALTRLMLGVALTCKLDVGCVAGGARAGSPPPSPAGCPPPLLAVLALGAPACWWVARLVRILLTTDTVWLF